MQPFVSVIVPVYSNWKLLPVCLDALRSQSYPRELFEVIVVNNESSAHLPINLGGERIRVLHEPKAGSYYARNAGIRASRSEILAFTDADCCPARDWIEAGVRVFAELPDVDRVAGNILVTVEGQPNSIEMYEILFAFQQKNYATRSGGALTANMLSRRFVFESIGLFNGEAKSGEDVEWGRRAQRAGHLVEYAQQVVVYHPARKTWKEIAQRARRVYGGQWMKGLGNTGPFNLLIVLRDFKSVIRRLITVFGTDQLNGPSQRLKVVAVIAFVRVVKLLEHVRLMLGGQVHRD